jgi:hypothetical protein
MEALVAVAVHGWPAAVVLVLFLLVWREAERP